MARLSRYIVLIACSLVATVHAATSTEAELLALQSQWAKARIAGDVPFLERLYAKEFWITSMDGTVVSRAKDIGVFASREMKPTSIVDEQMTVTAQEGFAIVNGIERMKGTYKDVPGDFIIRFTNVYVRRDGRWQMITHHATPAR
jgi:hypothetical protein